MLRNKKYNFLISSSLLVVFFLPIFVYALHSFSNHKHEICHSKLETHIHAKDLDCHLHLLKQNNAYLSSFNYAIKTFEKINSRNNLMRNKTTHAV